MFMNSALRRRILAVAVSGVAAAATVAAVAVLPGLDAAGNPVRIAGINWYGFGTTDEVVHGLWGQDYKPIVGAVKSFGYNTIRIPFSDQMVEGSKVPNQISFFGQNGPINTDLQGLTSMQILDKIITYAGSLSLKVILDNHRSEDGNSAEQNGLWWVVAMDLRNEPHTQSFSSYGTGSTWGTGNTATDWNLAAQKAGNAILAVNPSLLIAVEGISDWVNDSAQTVSDWWGGDLQPVATHPVQLAVADRLGYSPHDYGPHEFAQTWFNSSTTYASLSTDVWDKNWGYIAKQNIAPVWVGEFGTPNGATDTSDTTPGSQGQWFSGIVQYIKANTLSWTYWALNGEDAYGLVDNQYDPTPVSAAKQSALATLEFPFGTAPSSPPPTGPAGACSVAYVKQSEWPGGVVVQMGITNTGRSASLKDAGYNATIPPGGNVSFGFQGTWTTNDAAPASFTLNGAVCR